MKSMLSRISVSPLVTLLFLLCPQDAQAVAGRIGVHALRLEPRGDVEDLSEASWGGGLDVVVVVPGLQRLVAGALGFEAAKFDSKTIVAKEGPFEFRRELSTDQDFLRFTLGTEIGPHGKGFFQPHVGIRGAVVGHSISSTLTLPDDANPENTITQTEGEDDWGIGYDITLGVNLNYKNTVGGYGGVKYLRSFGLDQPLDFEGEMREIDPEYWEIFFGISLDLNFLEREAEDLEPEREPEPETEEDQWE
jgi:hypothetical protein